ncbi:hypothetical protein BC831DRAFT_439875, partial [Entophlyctis helioformis]
MQTSGRRRDAESPSNRRLRTSRNAKSKLPRPRQTRPSTGTRRVHAGKTAGRNQGAKRSRHAKMEHE